MSSKKTYSPFAVQDGLSYSEGMEEEQRKSVLDKEIGDFVRGEIHRKGSLPAPFSDSVGIDRAQFRRLLNGTARWNTWHMEVVAEKLGLPVSILISGSSALRVHHHPPSHQIPITPTIIVASRIKGDIEVKKENYYAVPLVSGEVAAGSHGWLSETEVDSFVWVYAPELATRSNHDMVAVKISERDGSSMIPTLYPGDIVLLDKDEPGGGVENFLDGKIYAVRDGSGGCLVKRVYKGNGGFILSSDNRLHPPVASEYRSVRDLIIGRVVWGWRNLLEV